MEIHEIFGYSIGLHKLKTLDIDKALEYVTSTDNKTYDEGLGTTGNDNGKTSLNQRFLDLPLFEDVKKEIEQKSLEYVKAHGHKVQSIGVTASWCNILNNTNIIHRHNHANSYVSGSFYLTEGSPILFYRRPPIGQLFTFTPEIEFDENNSKTWETARINPTPGSLLIFPSLVDHSVENNTNDFRCSIAFNTMPIGDFGGKTKNINIGELK